MSANLEDYIRCLGGATEASVDPIPECVSSEAMIGYRRDLIRYTVVEGETVDAYLLVPETIEPGGCAPAVAVWHQHNDDYALGKSEPAGLRGDPNQQIGPVLASEGFVVLCPDALAFEDRQDPTGKLEAGEYERFEHLRYTVRGKCLAWKHVHDMRRAIDALASLAVVDSTRIGCFGHSMGASHSWLLGPVEPRIGCIVANACLPTYEAIEANHLLHCFPNFVPRWLNHGDTPDIAALIAPRRLHINLGANDEGTPVAPARKGIDRIAGVYKSAGASSAFSHYIDPDAGHSLSPAMWETAFDTLRRHFQPNH